MPPFVPLFNGAQVEFLYELGGKIVENRLWFQSRQATVDSTQLLALAEGAAAWHTTFLLPLLSNELVLAAVVATRWFVPNDIFEVATLLPTAGGSAARSHSANVAFRIRFSNQFFRIGYYNANFVPGIPIDVVDTNTFDPTFAEAVYDAYSEIIDAAAVWGPFPAWQWVITSQILDGAYRDEQANTTAFTPFLPNLTVAPRRRRLPR